MEAGGAAPLPSRIAGDRLSYPGIDGRLSQAPRHCRSTCAADQAAEIRRLKAELKRVTEERDILKKAMAYFAKESR